MELTGKISKVAPNADPTTRIFDVEITVPNHAGKIRAGTIASLRVAGESAPIAATATIPLNSIVRVPQSRSDYAVYVVEEQGGKPVARLRKIQLGDIIGNEIVVASGIKLGDRVIMRGATMVNDGAEVRIIP